MTGKRLFGKTIECTCGRTHKIEPREVIYAKDALSRLTSVCCRVVDGRQVAVLMDVRTRAAAGGEAADLLSGAGWKVTEVLVPDPGEACSPVCDEMTKEALAGRINKPDLILTVGSGVVTDLGKWLAMEACIPFVSFATAASMNGYTSANVAPTISGVKTLLRARPPAALLSTPAVLRDAPYELTASGLGDALAKAVSSADWRLNHLLFGDYYCPKSVGLTGKVEPMYLNHPEAIRARRPEAIEALFQALVLTGLAMTMAETSSPASGGEHLISHCLDMMSFVDGQSHDLHGRQVGVGTILTSELYRRALAIDSPRFAGPPENVDSAFWGPLAGVVAQQYAEKLPRLEQAKAALSRPGAWGQLRRKLKPMLRPPEVIRDCLSRAGAAFRAEDIGCGRPRLLEAFLHAHEIRSRFTILDLARLLGLMPDAAAEITEQWA